MVLPKIYCLCNYYARPIKQSCAGFFYFVEVNETKEKGLEYMGIS